MNILEWLKEKLGFDEDDFDDIEIEIEGESPESLMDSLRKNSKMRRNINMDDRAQREQYVRECCELMSSANLDINAQQVEYQQVSLRLTDLEEIESLPMVDKSKVRLCAKKIVQIEKEESEYVRPVTRLDQVQYREMEKIEDEVVDVLHKMRKDEEYQMMVKRDLNLLEGEKGALAYQRKEEKKKADNARAFVIITLIASLMTTILLVLLDKYMKMDVGLGFVVLAAVFAMAITISFVMYQNAQSEIRRQNKKLNRAINLQNTVKIKYVNITNVLDYNYSKYKVMNAYELGYMYDKYKEEKAAREHDSELSEKLEDARRDLYHVLKQYHIQDPSIWVYQPGVLVYDEDAREVRHALIIQRQRLKKGIDFEKYNIERTEEELKSLIKEYPKYSKEILAIVSQYK